MGQCTHTEAHFSSNFSKVFKCMVWLCCSSFILIFILLFSYFGKKKYPNLLLLNLDNGGLCICCICIHKIKQKQKYFLYEIAILFLVVVPCMVVASLYGCCCQFRKMVLTNLFENKAKTKSHNTLNLEHRYVQKYLCKG